MQDKIENEQIRKLSYAEELPSEHDDLLIKKLNQTIKIAVKVLAVLGNSSSVRNNILTYLKR